MKQRGVDGNDAGAAAEKLFAGTYNKPSRLWGITMQELEKYAGVEGPGARELSNKLGKDQQANGKSQLRLFRYRHLPYPNLR